MMASRKSGRCVDVGLVMVSFACMMVLVVMWTCVHQVQGQMPIPKREVGFVYGKEGPARSVVQLDVYIDLACPDSKAVWPTMLQVADHYGPDRLQLTTHLFPLPYHRAAFNLAKGAHVLSMLSHGGKVYEWFNASFGALSSLSNDVTYNMTEAELIDRLSDISDQVMPGTSAQFKYLILNAAHIEMDTRVAWKYACTRGVASTPTFMVNDVVMSPGDDWTLDDWTHFLDPLVNDGSHGKVLVG